MRDPDDPFSTADVAALLSCLSDPEQVVRVASMRALVRLPTDDELSAILHQKRTLYSETDLTNSIYMPTDVVRHRLLELAVSSANDDLKVIREVLRQTAKTARQVAYGAGANAASRRIVDLISIPASEYVDPHALDPEELAAAAPAIASAWITSLFARIATPAYEMPGDNRLWHAEFAGQLAARLGKGFHPEIAGLFSVYRVFLCRSIPFWLKWLEEQGPRPTWFPLYEYEFGASRVIEWTVSRAGHREFVAHLQKMLRSFSARDRWAAAQLIESSRRYQREPYSPRFGGGIGPEDVAADAGMPTRDLPEMSADERIATVGGERQRYTDLTVQRRPARPSRGGRFASAKPPEPSISKSVARDAASSLLREAFPDIAADDVHPVASKTVNFAVGLLEKPTADTAGKVHLPESPPETEHTLQVHLLFGAASAWDTLIWSVARGTIKAACFSLPAPAIEGERALVEARANFYLHQRWCGEGQRNLDVRAEAVVAPLSEIPLPKKPPWRDGLVLQPSAQPPDLIVRIQKSEVPGDFVWSCLSPHLEFPPPEKEGDDRMSLKEDAATFIRNTFAPLANTLLSRLKLADVEGAGEKIYRSTPPHSRDCYWMLRRAAADGGFEFDSVQIVTDEPCVPWELMRMADRDRAPDVAPQLLAIRHCVGRWLAAESSAMRQHIVVKKVAVSASSYDGKLPWAESEKKLMVEDYRADPVPLLSDPLLDFLEQGAAQAVHLACHGRMLIADPDASELVMEDNPNNLTPLSIARSEVCNGLGAEHPLVFLNACEVGAVAASMSLVAGFPAAFLYSGAAALVSPLWVVNDERARRIAEEFYRKAFVAGGGKPLGAVLRDLRACWKKEKHLTFLAYVLYGDPLATVDDQTQLGNRGGDDAGRLHARRRFQADRTRPKRHHLRGARAVWSWRLARQARARRDARLHRRKE